MNPEDGLIYGLSGGVIYKKSSFGKKLHCFKYTLIHTNVQSILCNILKLYKQKMYIMLGEKFQYVDCCATTFTFLDNPVEANLPVIAKILVIDGMKMKVKLNSEISILKQLPHFLKLCAGQWMIN